MYWVCTRLEPGFVLAFTDQVLPDKTWYQAGTVLAFCHNKCTGFVPGLNRVSHWLLPTRYNSGELVDRPLIYSNLIYRVLPVEFSKFYQQCCCPQITSIFLNTIHLGRLRKRKRHGLKPADRCFLSLWFLFYHTPLHSTNGFNWDSFIWCLDICGHLHSFFILLISSHTKQGFHNWYSCTVVNDHLGKETTLL